MSISSNVAVGPNNGTGSHLKKYKRIKYLGRGSYGAAILVELRADASKKFVLKEIIIGHLSDVEQAAAKQEAEVLHQMSHSNITMYIESFVENSKLYIVMEHADGGDLSAAIQRRKAAQQRWPESELMRIFVQITLALQHVHNANILHRDLKSQNIFLTSKGVVKLGDFGIAKVLDASDDQARTTIGTPYYLSPEICESRPYGRKSDVWSLGVILFELLALELPFQANSLPALIHKICSTEPSYGKITPHYSEVLRELLQSMLNKDEEKRPAIKQIVKSDFMKTHICRLLSYTLKSGNGGVDVGGGINTNSSDAAAVVAARRRKSIGSEGSTSTQEQGKRGECLDDDQGLDYDDQDSSVLNMDPEEAERNIENARLRLREEEAAREKEKCEAKVQSARQSKREEEREKMRKFRQDMMRKKEAERRAAGVIPNNAEGSEVYLAGHDGDASSNGDVKYKKDNDSVYSVNVGDSADEDAGRWGGGRVQRHHSIAGEVGSPASPQVQQNQQRHARSKSLAELTAERMRSAALGDDGRWEGGRDNGRQGDMYAPPQQDRGTNFNPPYQHQQLQQQSYQQRQQQQYQQQYPQNYQHPNQMHLVQHTSSYGGNNNSHVDRYNYGGNGGGADGGRGNDYETAARREFFANRAAALAVKAKVEAMERGSGSRSVITGGADIYNGPGGAGGGRANMNNNNRFDMESHESRVAAIKAQREKERDKELEERTRQLQQAHEINRQERRRFEEMREKSILDGAGGGIVARKASMAFEIDLSADSGVAMPMVRRGSAITKDAKESKEGGGESVGNANKGLSSAQGNNAPSAVSPPLSNNSPKTNHKSVIPPINAKPSATSSEASVNSATDLPSSTSTHDAVRKDKESKDVQRDNEGDSATAVASPPISPLRGSVEESEMQTIVTKPRRQWEPLPSSAQSLQLQSGVHKVILPPSGMLPGVYLRVKEELEKKDDDEDEEEINIESLCVPSVAAAPPTEAERAQELKVLKRIREKKERQQSSKDQANEIFRRLREQRMKQGVAGAGKGTGASTVNAGGGGRKIVSSLRSSAVTPQRLNCVLDSVAKANESVISVVGVAAGRSPATRSTHMLAADSKASASTQIAGSKQGTRMTGGGVTGNVGEAKSSSSSSSHLQTPPLNPTPASASALPSITSSPSKTQSAHGGSNVSPNRPLSHASNDAKPLPKPLSNAVAGDVAGAMSSNVSTSYSSSPADSAEKWLLHNNNSNNNTSLYSSEECLLGDDNSIPVTGSQDTSTPTGAGVPRKRVDSDADTLEDTIDDWLERQNRGVTIRKREKGSSSSSSSPRPLAHSENPRSLPSVDEKGSKSNGDVYSSDDGEDIEEEEGLQVLRTTGNSAYNGGASARHDVHARSRVEKHEAKREVAALDSRSNPHIGGGSVFRSRTPSPDLSDGAYSAGIEEDDGDVADLRMLLANALLDNDNDNDNDDDANGVEGDAK